jgi:DNA-binding transcriptional LysR family regulator
MMDIDLRLARHFVALAETRHFGRAAARLHLTQSALTKQVRALERLVGAELVDRTRRPWRLTAAGEEVLALSRDLCARADRALHASVHSREPGMTIGLQSSGSGGWPVAAMLLACREALIAPVRCRVLDATSYVAALLDAEIDVLITRPAPRHPAIVSTGVLAEPRMLLVPRRWPQADATALAVAEACVLPLAYNPAMSACDNGTWALGDVRPVREARIVANTAAHMAEMLPDILGGTAAAVVAPPGNLLLPAAYAGLVSMPDAPPVQTAACWRADDTRDGVARMVVAIASALVSWTRDQGRAGARWAPKAAMDVRAPAGYQPRAGRP